MNPTKGAYTLRQLPLSMRLLFSSFLATVGIGYLAAIFLMFLLNVDPHRAMNMGLVQGVVMKYHGQRENTRLQAAIEGAMADKLETPDSERIKSWIRDGVPEARYVAEIQPILQKSCTACHNAQSGLPVPALTSRSWSPSLSMSANVPPCVSAPL